MQLSGAIGVLGGAFAPFHNGHLRLAIEAREQLDLAEVRLLPTGQPPHRARSRVSGARRLHWLQAAIAGVPGLCADDRELRRETPSYTVDTLAALRREYRERPLCLLIGADAFSQLHSWHQWTRLFELAHVVAATRPDAPPLANHHVAQAAVRAASPQALSESPAGSWLALPIPPLDISSTDIRNRLRDGRSLRGLVPDAIIDTLTTEDLACLNHDE